MGAIKEFIRHLKRWWAKRNDGIYSCQEDEQYKGLLKSICLHTYLKSEPHSYRAYHPKEPLPAAARLPPEATISAFVETGREESTVPVPSQRCYTGGKAIPSSLADTPCAKLRVHRILENINAILGTSYTRYTLFECGIGTMRFTKILRLNLLLKFYVMRNYDFGTAYAFLRPGWFEGTVLVQCICGTNKTASNHSTPRDVPPRRVWDLYANRVVPSFDFDHDPWGISHAWVDKKHRDDVLTPINGLEWPVPIPKDANLNLVRIEMLNLGAEYAWLDILCLRQTGGQREYLRMQEWRMDVPTIGRVYQWPAKVVCYFCGLGRPFCLKQGYFESDDCWFRRAWTLQETPEEPIIAGKTGIDEFIGEDLETRFYQQLESLKKMKRHRMTFDILLQMKNRVSTKPLDKVSGLVYLFQSKYPPMYDEEQSEEDAWAMLINTMHWRYLPDLCFFYPEPGNGKNYWHPSWEQVMKTNHLPHHETESEGHIDMYRGLCRHKGPLIDSGHVQALANTPDSEEPRQGELVVKDGTGIHHTFSIVTDHAYPIPDGSYTLLGSGVRIDYLRDNFMKHWVVGRRRENGNFEKLSVFCMADDRERRRLQELGVVKYGIETGLC